MLILNNDDVRALLTLEMAIDALKQSYREVAIGDGISRPRIDLRFPTNEVVDAFTPRRVIWGSNFPSS